MNRRGLGIIRIPKDWYVFVVLSLMIIINYLPFVYVVPRLMVSLSELALAAIMLGLMAGKDAKLCLVNFAILMVCFAINLLAYYHCWINTLSIGSFIIRSCMCWFYMGVGIFIKKYGSEETKRASFHLIMLLLVITSLTSILVVRDYPTAMRGLDNGSIDIKGLESILYRRNTATWSMVFGMTFLLPFAITAFKRTKNVVYLFVVSVLSYCILKSQITMGLLMAAAFILLIVLKPISPKKLCIIVGVLILLSWVFSEYLADLIYWLYINVFGGNTDNMLGKRFYQLYVSINGMKLVGTFGGRFDLYMTSIKTFLEHPLIGVNAHSKGTIPYSSLINIVGLHSQFFDMLATTGIFCTAILAYIFIYLIRKMGGMIEELNDRNLFYYSIIMLVAFMIMNPTYYSACVFLVVFLGPSYLSSMQEKGTGLKVIKIRLNGSWRAGKIWLKNRGA